MQQWMRIADECGAWHTFFNYSEDSQLNTMKSLAALVFILSCAFAVQAQTGAVGPNGPGGGSQGSGDNGKAYSNGAIPNPNEQTQNRPDSTLSNADTTYRHQQWNDGSASQQTKSTNKKRSTAAPKTGTTTTKKKK